MSKEPQIHDSIDPDEDYHIDEIDELISKAKRDAYIETIGDILLAIDSLDFNDSKSGDGGDGDSGDGSDGSEGENGDEDENEDEDTVGGGGGIPSDGFDHTLSIGGDDQMESMDYHLIVSGEAEAAEGGDEVFSTGGLHRLEGSVSPGNQDNYRYNGELLHIGTDRHPLYHYFDPERVIEGDIDWDESPIIVEIDGERLNVGNFCPDVPFDHVDSGDVPDWNSFDRGFFDEIATDWDDVAQAARQLGDGDAIAIDNDMDMPAESGTVLEFDQDRLTVAWLPESDGDYPELSRNNRRDDGWGNVQIQITGDNVEIWNPVINGPSDSQEGYGEFSRVRALEFDDCDNGVVINPHIHHWSHANISDRGNGAVVLGGSLHHAWQDGLGYGLAATGHIGGDPWTVEQVLTGTESWLERTTAYRVEFDWCRHQIEGGTHPSYEMVECRFGEHAACGGSTVDMHRPGGDLAILRQCAVHKPDQGDTDGEDSANAEVIRGWAETAVANEDTAFVGFDNSPDPDNKDRYRDEDMAIGQKYASSWDDWQRTYEEWDGGDGRVVVGDVDEDDDMRLVRGQSSFEDDEFKRVWWTDSCSFGDADEAPDNVPEEIL